MNTDEEDESILSRFHYDPNNVLVISASAVVIVKIVCNTILRFSGKAIR